MKKKKHKSPDDVLAAIAKRMRQAVAPPSRVTVNEWADAHRMIAKSARPGRWSTSYTPYLKLPMALFSSEDYEVLVLMTSAQVGKTAALENMIGWVIDCDSSPIMMIHPDENSIADFNAEKLMPMIAETPSLKAKVKVTKPGQIGSTERKKAFAGGALLLVSANSPASLRGRSMRRVLMDEIDAYKVTGEGDPVILGRARTKSYPGGMKKVVLASTPTDAGTSRIEKAYELGDKRKWFVPCKDCGVYAPFQWANVKWDKVDGQHAPETAYYACPDCGAVHTDADKPGMNAQGKWVATEKNPKDKKVASFHLNELASPWRTFEDVVRSFLEAKDDVDLLRAWTNTTLGETFNNRGERPEYEDLYRRVEPYNPWLAPLGVKLITAGVDVQHNRIALTILGHGAHRRKWRLHHEEILAETGDVNTAVEMWDQLEEYLNTAIPLAAGGTLPVRACAIDSSDGHTQSTVYNFCRGKRHRGVVPIKGSRNPHAQALGKVSPQEVNFKGRSAGWSIDLFPVGTHVLKATIYAQLGIKDPSAPGYMHFPDCADLEYFAQLCGEYAKKTNERGVDKIVWVQDRARVEALDCYVYAMAAAELVGISGAAWNRPTPKPVPTEEDTLENTADEGENLPAAAEKPPQPPIRTGPRRIKSGFTGGFSR